MTKKNDWDAFVHVIGNDVQVIESLTKQINHRAEGIENAVKTLREKRKDKKIDSIKISYDKLADILYVSFGEQRTGIAEEINNGIFMRVDPDSSEMVGITILDFCDRFIEVNDD